MTKEKLPEIALIDQLFDDEDTRAFWSLRKVDLLDQFFDIHENSLRSKSSIKAKSVPRPEKIKAMYSWRFARQVTTHDTHILA